jgi:hypothetical protein
VFSASSSAAQKAEQIWNKSQAWLSSVPVLVCFFGSVPRSFSVPCSVSCWQAEQAEQEQGRMVWRPALMIENPSDRFAGSGHESGYFLRSWDSPGSDAAYLWMIDLSDLCPDIRAERKKCGYRRNGETDCRPGRRKPRSAGGGRLVTLKNLVRSEVRSGVRVRKKCLNHPVAAECGCC